MAKQLICPINKCACVEENCAWWVEKGFIETKQFPKEKMTTHSPEGCCALKAIAWRLR